MSGLSHCEEGLDNAHCIMYAHHSLSFRKTIEAIIAFLLCLFAAWEVLRTTIKVYGRLIITFVVVIEAMLFLSLLCK